MSIFPRVIDREKDKFITLHMHIENNGDENIRGMIKFIITTPNGEKKKIEDRVLIKKRTKENKYYKYKVKKNMIPGRYYVDGRFFFKGGQVRSKTYKTDFFDIIYE